MTERCNAVLAACQCEKEPHGPEEPHVCMAVTYQDGPMGCGGSWKDTDDPDNPEIVSLPRVVAPQNMAEFKTFMKAMGFSDEFLELFNDQE